MSFRHDKIRGNHPITPKKGIREVDLNIREKGNNDTIKVAVKPQNKSWKMLPESERKILIPRIWNETLTENQRNSVLDKLIGDSVPFSEYKRLLNAKWSDLPLNLQEKLLEHYKFRTTLEYNGTEVFNSKHMPNNLDLSRDKTTAIIPNNKDVIIEFRPMDKLSKEEKKSTEVREGLDKIEERLKEAGAGGLLMITQRKGSVIRVQGNYHQIKDAVQKIGGKAEEKIGVQLIRVVNP